MDCKILESLNLQECGDIEDFLADFHRQLFTRGTCLARLKVHSRTVHWHRSALRRILDLAQLTSLSLHRICGPGDIRSSLPWSSIVRQGKTVTFLQLRVAEEIHLESISELETLSCLGLKFASQLTTLEEFYHQSTSRVDATC